MRDVEEIRKIDELIAEHLMGWTWWVLPSSSFWEGKKFLSKTGRFNGGWCAAEPCIDMSVDTSIHGPKLPEYSTDISAAWGIVEKLWKEFNIEFTINKDNPNSDKQYQIIIHATKTWNCDSCGSYHNNKEIIEEDTAPMAICRAALAIKGIEGSEKIKKMGEL